MKDLRKVKRAIRRRILKSRDAIGECERRAADQAIADRVRSLPEFREAACIMFYVDYHGEVSTRGLIEAAWEAGKTVAVPLSVPETKQLRIFELTGWDDLAAGLHGIMEPQSAVCREIPVEEIDLVLVPGVAFDPQLNRMGYGGGYYDRFAGRLRSGTPRIALAYELQLIDEVPVGIYDVPMDQIVTEKRLITAAD